MTKKLEILKASLEKKQNEFDVQLSKHMDDVRGAQGEPMSGHARGDLVLKRWDKQNNSLKTLDKSIERTKAAIEREEYKIANIEATNEEIPDLFLDLCKEGLLNQWRKYPNIFFVVGVDKARIGWDTKKKIPYHKFYKEIQSKDEQENFRLIWNKIYKHFNAEA